MQNRILKSDAQKSGENYKLCNCPNKNKCPLDGACCMEGVIQQAEVKDYSGQKFILDVQRVPLRNPGTTMLLHVWALYKAGGLWMLKAKKTVTVQEYSGIN